MSNTILKPMKDARLGVEILAYHKAGKNLHPVTQMDDDWYEMRWNPDYSQHESDYAGWIPMPVAELAEKQA